MLKNKQKTKYSIGISDLSFIGYYIFTWYKNGKAEEVAVLNLRESLFMLELVYVVNTTDKTI